MKVILLENVRRVGSIGEIIQVKRGFGRNYLIAQNKALFASKENIKEVEKIKNELSKKDLDKKNEAKMKHGVMNAAPRSHVKKYQKNDAKNEPKVVPKGVPRAVHQLTI